MKTTALLLVALLVTAFRALAQEGASPGRFLYANDDDWDWATPSGATPKSALAEEYGEVDWSALDWLEEGLPEVRGLLIGTWPNRLGEDGLGELRRNERIPRHYERIEHRPGTLTDSLVRREANLVILMRDRYQEFAIEFDEADLRALQDFVLEGGRLMVLDDWQMYLPVLDAFVDPQVILDRKPRRVKPRLESRLQPPGHLALESDRFDATLEMAREVDTGAELRTVPGNSKNAPQTFDQRLRERKVLLMKVGKG